MFIKNGATSVKARLTIKDANTGLPKTGLTNASAGLLISLIADNEAAGTPYSGANIQTIAVLGTFAAPAAGKVRFAEVDAVNHAGLYEVQAADARWGVANAQSAVLSVSATGCLQVDKEVQLVSVDFNDGVRMGMTALPNSNNLAVAAGTMQQGATTVTTLTANIFSTNLASVTVDEYKGRTIRFTSGGLVGQEQQISAYGATGQVTVATAFTAAPASADTFIII